MTTLLGVDIGTTGAKALAIRPDGTIAAESFSEYEISSPKSGWAEQDPEDWWNAFYSAIEQLFRKGIKPDDIVALGLSGQMHTVVFLDRNLKVIRPAIMWCDVRTTSQCRQMTERLGFDGLRQEASNPALEGFTAPKILWLRDNEPKNYARLRHVLIAKDYIRYKLTGELATDISDAAGTILFNVKDARWSDTILSALDMDPSILPKVVGSHEVAGRVNREASFTTGLKEGTPVVGGGADNACAAVGAGIIDEGAVQSSIGSSGVVLAALAKHRVDEAMRLHCMNHAAPGRWYLMGVMLAAGLSLKWFKETLCIEETEQARRQGRDAYDVICDRAATAPPGCEGLFFLPYLTGERTPHSDPNARGVFCGLSLRHTKAHMARAVLEGVAFGLRDSLELVRQLDVRVSRVIIVGGGARSALWRQIQADVFGQPVCTLKVKDAAPFGAALLAGIGAKVFRDFGEAVQKTVRHEDDIAPIAGNVTRYNDMYPLYRELYSANARIFQRIAELPH
ncbi:MAG: xylulokinase [Candidatus Abyssubacteria bacterium]